MNLIGTILVYVAFVTVFLGGVSVIRPLRFLGIASRPYGIFVVLCGIVVFLIGASLPAREETIATQTTRLDDFMPAYQFSEFHSLRVKASPERVYRALKEVRADEIFLFRTLVWIRRFGQTGPESILNPGHDLPLLDVATRTSFLLLAEEPNHEIVLGTLVAAPRGVRLKKDPTPEDFKALHAPGFALAATNFRIEAAPNGETLITTETRVNATDAPTRKRFAAYWRTIYPGSALIRRMWLRAIRKRSENMIAPGDGVPRRPPANQTPPRTV